jgi:uncharacterized protein
MRLSAMANAEADIPSRTLSGPTLASERNPVIDILRGFALFGILLVNFPGSEAGRSGSADDAVRRLLSILVSGKFYTTFSFLFGLGFALQLLRARSRGKRVVPVYVRRMLVLFLIGLGHAVLIWQGDVLMIYAFMGLFLIPLRNWPARVLLPLAVVVVAGEYFLSATERPYLVRDLVPRISNPELEQDSELQDALAYNEARDAGQRLWAACQSGTYLEAVAARFEVWRLRNRYTFRYIWLTSFAMFLVGLCAGRHALIRHPPVRSVLIQRIMGVALPIWLLLGVLTTYGPQVLGASYYKIHWKLITLAWVVHEPAGSLFYVSGILTLLALWPRWIARLASLGAVGRMALSNYLLQSVIGTLLYYGYGLGLEAKLGMLSGLLVAMAVFIVQIILSRWWLGHFQFGPFEWVWRLLTYGRVPPLRLIQASSAQPGP